MLSPTDTGRYSNIPAPRGTTQTHKHTHTQKLEIVRKNYMVGMKIVKNNILEENAIFRDLRSVVTQAKFNELRTFYIILTVKLLDIKCDSA